jgi:spermidine/putrescine-binding protein
MIHFPKLSLPWRAALPALALLLEVLTGCGRRIDNPASKFLRPNREQNAGDFGEIIINPREAAAKPSPWRPGGRQVIQLMVPTSFYPEIVDDDRTEASQRRRCAAIDGLLEQVFRPLDDATGITVRVVHPAPVPHPGAAQQALRGAGPTPVPLTLPNGSQSLSQLSPGKLAGGSEPLDIDVFEGSWQRFVGQGFHVALVPDFDAAELYDARQLIPLRKKELSNLRRVNRLFYLKFKSSIESRGEGNEEYITDFCIPYQWALVGMAYNPDMADRFPRSWSALLEPVKWTEMRLLHDDLPLLKSAMIYLRGKLTAAEQRLRVETVSGAGSDPGAPRLEAAAEHLRAYLTNSEKGPSEIHRAIGELFSYLREKTEAAAAPATAPAGKPADAVETQGTRQPNSAPATTPMGMLGLGEDSTLRKLEERLREVFGAPEEKASPIQAPLMELVSKGLDAAEPQLEMPKGIDVAAGATFTDDEARKFAGDLMRKTSGTPGAPAPGMRGALALLLGYAQYLPRLDSIRRASPGLAEGMVRQVAEIQAGLNLLKNQAWHLRGQAALYDNSVLANQWNDATLVQLRGPQASHALRTSPAATPLPGERIRALRIKYLLPVEGTVGSMYHLVLLKGAEEPETVSAAHAVVDYLLRPEVAGMVSNILLHGTTEDDARAFVEREVLNGPSYERPEDLSDAHVVDLNKETRRVYRTVGSHLKQWYRNAQNDYLAEKALDEQIADAFAPREKNTLPQEQAAKAVEELLQERIKLKQRIELNRPHFAVGIDFQRFLSEAASVVE